MATFVAEAFISEPVKLLLGMIASGEFLEFFRSTKLDRSLLEKLEITLLSLQAVLNDAEQKQITNGAVQKWLVKLQDAVFDAEDLFDQINTEKLRCELKAEQKGKRAKFRKILSSYFKSSYKTINSEMKELHIKLNGLVGHIQNLGLSVGVSSTVWHSTPTSSVAEDESTIYGRDNDKEKLKGFLLSDDAREGVGKIGVVSIVGMGGLGKTTLAKLLYNDSKVDEKFTLKGWAHISKDFDVLKVTKALLESITKNPVGANNPDTLQVQLQKILNGQMFLLVLDDIWDVDYVDWKSLMDIFNVGEAGSRIVVTTRNKSDALTMKTFLPIHDLERLGSEDCWYLLDKHAFGASNYQQRSDLEEVGRQIAQKCDGLPLAAVALGGLLRNKLSPDDWNHVLKSNIWELQNTKVQPGLLLSYHYLPGHLKRCFVYCAIFPKNSDLKKEMIVQLWIAEGLVLQPKSEKSWEQIAEEYFDELVSRSLIQRRSVDGNEIFEMHDLMNDLATTVSSPYCARLDEQKPQESLERVRHLSYNRNGFNYHNKFDRLHGLKGLRTFLSLPLQDWWLSDNCMSDKVVGDLLIAMKHLHSLSLYGCSLMTKVPTSIGNLIYLRYLNLSSTPIVKLPLETCKLVNLQTLIVSRCRSLTELPEDMGKLVSLLYLDVSDTPIVRLPSETCKLVNLQTLLVSYCTSLIEFPDDMGKLVNLRNLDVRGTPIVRLPSETCKLVNLQTLLVSYCTSLIELPDDMGKLVNLRNLDVSGTPIVKLPLETCKLVNLQTLIMSQCRSLTELPEDMGKLVSLRNLDVSKTRLREMPVQIGKLKTLQTLSNFIVSKQRDGLKVGELGKLPHLRGNLCISELQNVIDPSDASQANLETKKQIEELILDWRHPAPSDSNLQIQSVVLERLQPALNLKSLTIGGYGGTNFPNWLGDSSYGNMVYLEINDCDNCSRLPPLGQLGKLKELSISGMKSVKSVGAEFNGNGSGSSFRPFPSLETLSFVEMPEWEEWNLIEGTITEFPNLRRLTLQGCPKLKGKLPISLPSLINLKLSRCPLMEEPWSSDDNSNMSLSTNDCESLKFIAHKSLHTYTKLEHLRIANSCYSMTSFTLGTFPVLKTLIIRGCEKLKSIVIAEDASQQQSLSSLRDITITDCDELESLLEPMNTLVGLHDMQIYNLPNLQSIAKDGFPMNLQELAIGGSIGGDLLNTRAWECLTCLSKLYIDSGDIVEALMNMEAPLLPTSLVTLQIYDLGDIECLDGKWLHHLTSLQNLKIWKAPNLNSLPEEGFPSSLSKLFIYECPLLEAI